MKTIKGDLILTEDYKIEEDLKVEGNIICKGGVWNINAWDIDAWNINARNIDAVDINAEDINARNINAWDIICEKRIKNNKNVKTICRIYIKNRNSFERKEQEKSK